MAVRPVAADASSPEAMSASAEVSRARAADWFTLLRPRQWVKNGFIIAPLLFSGRAFELRFVVDALVAFVCFSFAASGIYCWNDVADADADRAHPIKRLRPVASGRISPAVARGTSVLLVSLAIAVSLLIATDLTLVIGAYILLNVAYTARLKHVVLVDVFAIAAFFILRLLAGVTAIHVQPSVWLLLCGGLLSLYLGFAKRRHEIALLGGESVAHRAVLGEYDEQTLDQISGILLAVTIVSYIMYTISSPTAIAHGSDTLSYSTVFVLYGVFRYLYLVRRSHGGDPAGTLLTDRALLLNVALWIAYCAWAIYLH